MTFYMSKDGTGQVCEVVGETRSPQFIASPVLFVSFGVRRRVSFGRVVVEADPAITVDEKQFLKSWARL